MHLYHTLLLQNTLISYQSCLNYVFSTSVLSNSVQFCARMHAIRMHMLGRASGGSVVIIYLLDVKIPSTPWPWGVV